MLVAVTRAISPLLADCELTHLSREPIDVSRAVAQHASYEAALRSLGATVVRAPDAPGFPDGVFIEDIAVVLQEVAIITQPGALSRRGEREGFRETLREYRELASIGGAATLDGGDVIQAGRTIFVGRSARTNDDGIRQLARLAEPFGYRVEPVAFTDCLHLKSAATALAPDVILLNPSWVSPDAFAGCDILTVEPTEPYGANAVRVGGALVHGSHFPRTRARLEERGFRVVPVDCDELAKAEGAVTCCCLLVETEGTR